MNDAEVLYAAARRLFDESAEKFRRAHVHSLRSENALTMDEQLKLSNEALEQEKQALAMWAEAIENQRQANRIWRIQATDQQQNGNGCKDGLKRPTDFFTSVNRFLAGVS